MPYRFPDYQVAGGDGDTTIFLLHGAYGSKDYFRGEIATLACAGLRVVAWDAPGYGIIASRRAHMPAVWRATRIRGEHRDPRDVP